MEMNGDEHRSKSVYSNKQLHEWQIMQHPSEEWQGQVRMLQGKVQIPPGHILNMIACEMIFILCNDKVVNQQRKMKILKRWDQFRSTYLTHSFMILNG